MALALVTPDHVEAPFAIGCFHFHATGVTVQGRPTFEETQAAFDFVTRAVKCSGFWIADLIYYIDRREDFGDRRDALISVETGLSVGSVQTYRSIGKKVPPENRVEGVPFGHHQAVASLAPAEQTEWLEQSKVEGWTQSELRAEVRRSKRLKLLDGRAPGLWTVAVEVLVEVEAKTAQKAEKRAAEAVGRLLGQETAADILGVSVGVVMLK